VTVYLTVSCFAALLTSQVKQALRELVAVLELTATGGFGACSRTTPRDRSSGSMDLRGPMPNHPRSAVPGEAKSFIGYTIHNS
jgi:hypothetical protein